MYKEYMKEIREASLNNRLIFFVGAGISRCSGYKGWNELINQFEEELNFTSGKATLSNEELLQIPEVYRRRYGEEKYNEILRKEFSVIHSHNVLHEKMMDMKPKHFITTNYDNLIEQSSQKYGVYFNIISHDSDVSKVDSPNYILKVHGDFSNGYEGQNIVLSEKDYLDYESNYPLISNLMKTLLSTHLVVFIGYRIGDYNIKLILNWLKNIQGDDFKPIFISIDKERMNSNKALYYASRGLRIIEYSKLNDVVDNTHFDRYNYVLKYIVENSIDMLQSKSLENITEYIYEQVKPLSSLLAVRQYDFNLKFNSDYWFDSLSRYLHKDFKGFNYINYFLNSDVKTVKKEFYEKYIECKKIFNDNDIFIDASQRGTHYSIPSIKITNPEFYKEFDAIKEMVSSGIEETSDLYYHAFFYASSGMFIKAYKLYTQVATEALKENHWLLHYLAQANRYHIYNRIKSGLYSNCFTNDEIDFVKGDMGKFNLFELFNSMPYQFQKSYKFLEWLNSKTFFSNDRLRLQSLIDKSEISIKKGTITYGITPELSIYALLRDNIRFFSENYLLDSYSQEFSDYILKSVTALLKRTCIDNANEANQNKQIFPLDFHFFIILCRYLKFEDIKHLERVCDFKNIVINDNDMIGNYVERILIKTVMQFKIMSDKNPFLEQLYPETRNALYLLKYIELNEDLYNRVFELYTLNFPIRHVLNPYQIRYEWIQDMCEKNGLSDSLLDVLDQYIISRTEAQGKSIEDDFTKKIVKLISNKRSEYISNRLSNYVLSLKGSDYAKLNFVSSFNSILNVSAKSFLHNYQSMT